jgi:type II secretory pathway pseudopilin PulG
MKRARKNGFTMIDTLLAIALLSAAFVALGAVISDTALKNAGLDNTIAATFLAREKLATEKVKDFANVTSTAQTNFAGSFSNYNYTVNVSYVNSDNLDTPVVGPTNYKRIEVVVGAGGWSGSVHLYDLVVNLQ